ncbi:MAG: PEP-CTERM sorting domain-containing protein [Cyanobacteria bacterium SBLK]|nr:PEP-CTERM sorting domain-containing protein [Cyanobacteria bacterium SBLK]
MAWLLDRKQSLLARLGHPKTILIGSLSILCALGLNARSVLAGTLYQDWNYAIDSAEDSLGIGQVGNTVYELNAMAIKQTEERIFVALKSNMPWGGTHDPGAYDRHVGYSDLLFNFTGTNLNTANANSSLIGIRFSDNNDSDAPSLGVYGNVNARDKARENDNPQGSLQGYINAVHRYGKTASIGDLAVNDPYFDLNSHIPSLINTGNRIGDVEILSDLTGLGLDFDHFNIGGSYTYGFSFDRALLPDGDFIAHLSLDCNNDHIALLGTVEPEPEPEPVPEPSTALALGALSLLAGVTKIRRRRDCLPNS